MAQGGSGEYNPNAPNDATIIDGGNNGTVEVGTPNETTAEAIHSAAGPQHSAADAALAAESFDETSDTERKKADGGTERFDIGSQEDDPDADGER